MPFANRLALMVVALGLVAVAGCGGGGSSGGGGGDGSGFPNPPVVPTTYSVSGTVTGNPFLAADSDVNDALTTPVRNNSRQTAQLIVAPAIVKGYVTQIPTGRSGDNFAFTADRIDLFEAELRAGQVIFLSTAEVGNGDAIFSPVDLDLRLFDANGDLVAESNSVVSSTEEVSVPSDGRYYVGVYAFQGEAIYTLTMATELVTARAAVPLARLSPHTLSVEQTMEAPALQAPGLKRQSAPLRHRRGETLRLDPDRLAERARTFRLLNAEEGARSLSDQPLPSRQAARLEMVSEVKRINAALGYDAVAPMEQPRLFASDPVPDPFAQWNMPAIGWTEAQSLVAAAEADRGDFSYRPLVAVIDSGVFRQHPEIGAFLTDQRDFVPASVDGDGFDREAQEIVRPSDPATCHSFHGTHVTSIATAPQNNQGITGVLPGADILAIKLGYSVDPECDTLPGDLVGAIRYAAGLPNPSGELPPRRADVINMSLGTTTPSAAVRQAIEDARDAGVIIVAAAGNAGGTAEENAPNYPAAYDGVIAVAATNLRGEPAYYSSAYAQVDIAAPGGDGTRDENLDGFGDSILGAIAEVRRGSFEPSYGGLQGTSMAAPHVAGGIALMKTIAPGLTPDDIDALLANGALTVDIGTPGRDEATGYGLMSLPKMVEAALDFLDGDVPDSPEAAVVTTNPRRLDFGVALDQITVDVSLVGRGGLTVTGLRGEDVFLGNGDPFITFNDDGVDADGFGSYIFAIDRQALPEGTFEGRVIFDLSDGSMVTLPVSVFNRQVRTVAESASIFLIFERETPDGINTDLQLAATGGLGSVIERDGIPPGTYRIIFGTDLDNDNFICDAGELCGTYPSNAINFEGSFDLSADVAGLDLAVTNFAGTVLSSFSGALSLPIEPMRIDRAALPGPVVKKEVAP